MNSRRILPLLAVLAVAALPALAQYGTPRPTAPPPPTGLPSTTAPAPTEAPAAPAPTPAPAPAAALPPIPPHNCGVAPEYPGKSASNAKVVVFNRDYKTYGDCIKDYVDHNRAWVNAIIDANNKAVDEYNKYTENLKKLIDAAKD